MPQARPVVRVTQIGEYIRHRGCERRFKLDFNDRELTNALPFFFQLSSTMDPVLSAAGRQREREWEAELRSAGLRDLCRYDKRPGEDATPWELFARRARALEPGEAAYGREIEVAGEIGAFRVVGRIDFALILLEGGRPRLRLVECKASRRDRTYHRIQLVLYRMLLGAILADEPLAISGSTLAADGIECVVARIDEATNRVDQILQLAPLDLTMEEADARRLLAQEGALARILATDLEALPYQLDSRCDDCALNVHCLPESARRRRLELLGIDPSTVRAIRSAGVWTIDDLAALDPAGPAALRARADPGFSGSMPALVAQARARRRTLPGGEADPAEPEVLPLPHAGKGQLPEHGEGGMRLVRVFVSVCYDYVENRIGALAAHITRSNRPLSTLFVSDETGRWRPDPEVREQWEVGKGPDGRTLFEERAVQGEEIVGVIRQPWSGEECEDTCQEARLLGEFFRKTVEAIQRQCGQASAPVHFYLWSRGEMSRLVEACSRCGGELLGHLRELLGCRESLEQLIFSCLQEEVESRYALGWTGRGLVVVTALKWFGRRFHWTRKVGEEIVALDRLFAQDLFDFKTELRYGAREPGQPWRPLEDAGAARHAFELRACFHDALPAPYWRACWGTLPEPDAAPRPDPKLAAALRRYRAAGRRDCLRAYLAARVQALRWVEESVRFKNEEIRKPPLRIADLTHFSLGVHDAAQAALDFLRLEQHVKGNDWIAAHLVPPLQRVLEGDTLPLRDVRPVDENRLEARIDLTGYGIDRATLADRCSFDVGSFVRVSPAFPDPARAQTLGQLLGGSTGRIEAFDAGMGVLRIAGFPSNGRSRYVLRSRAWGVESEGYETATLDESPTDFVGSRVDRRLQSNRGAHVYRWFDPRRAQIPPQTPLVPGERGQYERFLCTLEVGREPLERHQLRAAVDGLSARVQLLQGPPGTGKTQTTAVAILLRILARRRPGEVVLVAANTHTAVDTLLARLARLLPGFRAHAGAAGLPLPPVRLARAASSEGAAPVGDGVVDLGAGRDAGRAEEMRHGAVLVIGGTPNAVLKLAEGLDRQAGWRAGPDGFQAAHLVVDEASMMVLPYFLALASLVREDGEILLAGDHRQLAPIVGHDWEQEDRPPAVLYQPFVSAYVAVLNLKREQALPDSQILNSALQFTFRLPLAIRELLARLYREDGIELDGFPAAPGACEGAAGGPWERLWQGSGGLFLVTHDERGSKRSNEVEAAILAEILAAGRRLGRLAPGAVGLVMPHRAQRSLLRARLAEYTQAVDVIDTVERLQGGERETILVSGTASDPAAIGARAEFILNLNRANVAFSRARRRLIVVCAETLLEHIPPEVEHYAAASLWKSLRHHCSEPVATVQVRDHRAAIFTAPASGRTSPEMG